MNRRVITVITACLTLSACSSGTYWQRTWDGALQVQEHIVSSSPWGPSVKGWTVCNKAERKCDIYLVSGPDIDCYRAHELRHTRGEDHPGYKRAFLCNAPAFDLLNARR